MNVQATPGMQPAAERGMGWGKVLLIAIAVAVVSSLLTIWLVSFWLFPKQFQPVQLSAKEAQVLDAKLAQLDPAQRAATAPAGHSDKGGAPGGVQPEAYSEKGASREINLTERELNGLLARNTDLAHRLAIDLSDNLASAKLIVPVDPDFPILGGKTIRASAGLEFRYADGRPVVVLRGVSLWGVPMPNAWLGGIKNVDLVREFGGSEGFWKTFADGVDFVRVENGRLTIKLKE